MTKKVFLFAVLVGMSCGPQLTPEQEKQVRIAKTGTVMQRMQLARTQRLCAPAVQILVSDTGEELLQALAENTSIDKETQEQLFEKGTLLVRIKLANNPSIDPGIQEKYIGHTAAVSLARNRNMTPEIQSSLLADRMNVRYELARNTHVLPEILDSLANDPSAWVRSAVAGNASTVERLQRKLASDKSQGVQKALAANLKIAKAVQQYIAENGSEEVLGVLIQNEALDLSLKYSLNYAERRE